MGVKSFEDLHYCVYRYVDMNDGVVKYIGIVNNGTLPNRHKQHQKDDWYRTGNFVCEYIKMNNQSETEAMESHLISYYHTDNFYNKSKSGWGLNSLLPVPDESEWKIYEDTVELVVENFKSLLTFQYEKGIIKKPWFDSQINDLDSIMHAAKVERYITAKTGFVKEVL